MMNNKKGMALVLVIMVLFVISALLMMIYSTSSEDVKKTVLKKEKVRAEMLAKGAVQHAMLKVRFFPTEFYDATKLKKGEGFIADKEITADTVDPTYLGEISKEDDGAFVCSGEFVRDLGMQMSEELEPGFVEDEVFFGQVKVKSPYGGTYFIKKLELLNHDEANKFDTLKIDVYAKEISGFTNAVLSPSVKGTKHEKNLNEGLNYSVIKELKWK